MRDWISKLERTGKLSRISEPKSPILEVADVGIRNPNPILFEDVDGNRLALNLMNSRELLAQSLDLDPRYLPKQILELEAGDPKLKINDHLPEDLSSYPPDLNKLPVLKHFPQDPGRYITAGIVISGNPNPNASIHRLLVMDSRRLVMRLVESRHLYQIYSQAASQGSKLPVGIAIGVDPKMMFAASTRVDPGMEFNFFSKLKRSQVELYTLDNGVLVPDAEIILEGYIHPSQRAPEGPFLDITRTYDIQRLQPVILVEKMHLKPDFIYHGLIPGSIEHQLLMGVPYEYLIYKSISKYSRVLNVYLTPGSCHYFHAVIQIQKQFEGEPKNLILGAFSAHPSLKMAMVVDDDIDIFDPADLEYALATRFQPDRDMILIQGVRGSSLDPSAHQAIGAKWGIDATKDLENPQRFSRIKF